MPQDHTSPSLTLGDIYRLNAGIINDQNTTINGKRIKSIQYFNRNTPEIKGIIEDSKTHVPYINIGLGLVLEDNSVVPVASGDSEGGDILIIQGYIAPAGKQDYISWDNNRTIVGIERKNKQNSSATPPGKSSNTAPGELSTQHTSSEPTLAKQVQPARALYVEGNEYFELAFTSTISERDGGYDVTIDLSNGLAQKQARPDEIKDINQTGKPQLLILDKDGRILASAEVERTLQQLRPTPTQTGLSVKQKGATTPLITSITVNGSNYSSGFAPSKSRFLTRNPKNTTSTQIDSQCAAVAYSLVSGAATSHSEKQALLDNHEQTLINYATSLLEELHTYITQHPDTDCGPQIESIFKEIHSRFEQATLFQQAINTQHSRPEQRMAAYLCLDHSLPPEKRISAQAAYFTVDRALQPLIQRTFLTLLQNNQLTPPIMDHFARYVQLIFTEETIKHIKKQFPDQQKTLASLLSNCNTEKYVHQFDTQYNDILRDHKKKLNTKLNQMNISENIRSILQNQLEFLTGTFLSDFEQALTESNNVATQLENHLYGFVAYMPPSKIEAIENIINPLPLPKKQKEQLSTLFRETARSLCNALSTALSNGNMVKPVRMDSPKEVQNFIEQTMAPKQVEAAKQDKKPTSRVPNVAFYCDQKGTIIPFQLEHIELLDQTVTVSEPIYSVRIIPQSDQTANPIQEKYARNQFYILDQNGEVIATIKNNGKNWRNPVFNLQSSPLANNADTPLIGECCIQLENLRGKLKSFETEIKVAPPSPQPSDVKPALQQVGKDAATGKQP